jgi:hypothetical protein
LRIGKDERERKGGGGRGEEEEEEQDAAGRRVLGGCGLGGGGGRYRLVVLSPFEWFEPNGQQNSRTPKSRDTGKHAEELRCWTATSLYFMQVQSALEKLVGIRADLSGCRIVRIVFVCVEWFSW